MRELRITEDDLKREIPRIEQELNNMHFAVPSLVAQNLAAEMVIAHSPATRKGGVSEQIKSITLITLQGRIKKYYKPKNAILIMAGGINPEKVISIIEREFGEIESGENIALPPPLQNLSPGKTEKKGIDRRSPHEQSHAAIAFPTPKSSDALFPAFLIIAARLQINASKLNPPQGAYPVTFAPLDRPEVLLVNLPVGENEESQSVLERLKSFATETAAKKLDKRDVGFAKQVFGFSLGLQEYPDKVLANNVYGVAFSLGRRAQLGFDNKKLLKDISQVTQEELRKASEECFDTFNCGSVIAEVSD